MKKDKSNFIIYGILILIIIVAAIVIFDTTKQEVSGDSYTGNFIVYNDYNIYENQIGDVMFHLVEVFDSNKNRFLFNFRYLPDELEDIPVEEGIVDKVLYTDENKDTYKSKIYISVNPSMTGQEALSIFGLAQILWIGKEGHEGVYKIPTQTAFSSDYEGNDIPMKDCDDANEYIGVILVDYGDTRIYSDGYCVVLNGNNLEELRMVNEKLSYMLLGVI